MEKKKESEARDDEKLAHVWSLSASTDSDKVVGTPSTSLESCCLTANNGGSGPPWSLCQKGIEEQLYKK